MTSRDLFHEIKALRARNPRRTGPFGDALRRLDPMLEATRLLVERKRLTKPEKEFVRYTAVAAVACVEGYFKGLMCDLVNLGPPFLQNAVNFKEIRVTLEGLVGTHTRQVSVGELLTHTLRINNLEDIDRHMSIVLGKDFLKTLKSVQRIPSKYIACLVKTFESRHILAHEIAPNFKTTPSETFDQLLAVFALLLATEHYIQNTLLPGLKSAA